MASPFDAAIAAAAATHDSIMGEDFIYRPRSRPADVNKRETDDGSRAVIDPLRAVWGEPAARFDSGPARLPGVEAERPGHATARPFVSFRLSLLPYRPRDGDMVERKATGEKFRVAEVLPSTPGLVRLDLNRM